MSTNPSMPSPQVILDPHTKAECEAGAMRELLEECITGCNLHEWLPRVRNLLNVTDLGELTKNQLLQQRDQIRTLRDLANAQSMGIDSLSRQNRWLREWREMAVPLLQRMQADAAYEILANRSSADEMVHAKVTNLLTAQYDGQSAWRELMDTAVCFELVPDKLEIIREADNRWYFHFTAPATIDSNVLVEGFDSPFAAYAYFQATPSILEACK